MVPLWRRGSIPRERTRSEQVIGPLLIRAERTAVRMMEVSIGCVAVCFGIVVDGGGTRQGAPQGSGGDGQDRSFRQEAVEAAPPGDRFCIFVVVLLADSIPVAGGAPIAEGVAVHGVAAVEQDQQFGIVVVVHHQCPGAHGAAEHGVPQGQHLVGGEGGGDGGGHRIGVGCFGIVVGEGGRSQPPAPVGVNLPGSRSSQRSVPDGQRWHSSTSGERR